MGWDNIVAQGLDDFLLGQLIAAVNRMLQQLPRGSTVEIDGTNSRYIHADVVEILNEFDEVSSTRGIDVELLGIPQEGRLRTMSNTPRSGSLDGFPVRD